jgi:protein-S-isoprenylcysteine O-methyltransferase Ste14
MLDFEIAGPILSVLIVVDIALHIYMDMKKIQGRGLSALREPDAVVSKSAMVAIASSTLLAFALVLLIPIVWLNSQGPVLVQSLFPIADSPVLLWSGGLVTLSGGVILHGWSRKVRQLHASSWTMSETHKLIMNGPYSRIRHPSYLSYILSFIGISVLD